MQIKTSLVCLVLSAAVFGVARADRTISEDYSLTADEDWTGDGVVTIAPGCTVDLAGHALSFAQLAGGVPHKTGANLTEPDGRILSAAFGSGTFHASGPAVNAFSRDTSNSGRVLLQNFSGCTFDYDFGLGNEKVVNAYRICIGVYNWQYSTRSPSSWEFYGTADDPSSPSADWTLLDSRSKIKWSYSDWTTGTWSDDFSFANTTAYRAYRMKITKTRAETIAEEQGSTVSGEVDLEFRGLDFRCTDDLAARIFNIANDNVGTGTCGGFGNGPVFYSCTATRAFDRDLTVSTGRAVMKNWSSSSEFSFWYRFAAPTGISAYAIRFGVADNDMTKYGQRSPAAWELYGTTDESTPSASSNWVLLDSRTQSSVPPDGWVSYAIASDKIGLYRAYRLRITAILNPNQEWMEFREIALASDSAAPAILTAYVPENVESVNSGVTFSGSIRLVKDGQGVYTAATTDQDYLGGNDIVAGTFKCGKSGSDNAYGPAATTIVRSGATFDCNGQPGHEGRSFVLDGGTLANSVTNALPASERRIDDVTLLSDSFLSGGDFGLGGATATLKTNGHRLTVNAADGQCIYLGDLDVEGDGCIFAHAGGWLGLGGDGSDSELEVSAPQATLETDGVAINCMGAASFGKYVAGYDGGCDAGSQGITVLTTFKPLCARWHTVNLADGATNDLSEVVGVFPSRCHFDAEGCDAYGGLNYETDATNTVFLGERELTIGDQIIQWSAIPNASFVLAGSNVGDVSAKLTTTGLYYGEDPDSDVVANAAWTGAGVPNDLTDPDNWACTNAAGRAVVGGVPSTSAIVVFGGDLGFSLSFENVSRFGGIRIGTSRLVADSDWTELPNLGDHLLAGATVDLNGHVLRVNANADFTQENTFTDNSSGDPGELRIAVAKDRICVNSALEFCGNLKLVKDGEGDFVANRKNQSYVGGTVIVGGTLGIGDAVATGERPFGGATATDIIALTVSTNGTLALNGKNGWTNVDLLLAGGTLSGTATQPRFHDFALAADSFLAIEGGNLGSVDYPLSIDLGAWTLTTTSFDVSSYFYVSALDGTGTLALTGDGGTGMLRPVASGKGCCDMRTVDFVQRRGILMGAPIEVNDYTSCRLESDGIASKLAPGHEVYSHAGDYPLKVYGTFTPTTDYFLPPQMQNGSTLDLSARTEAWPLATKVSCGATATTFATGASVTVKPGAWAVAARTGKVIEWSEIPADVRFVADADLRQAALRFVKRADGLWLERRPGLCIIVR